MAESKFRYIVDGDHFIDGFDAADLKDAQNGAIETLILWMQEESCDWAFLPDGTPNPTEDQKENWDYMIYNCGVWVEELDPETGKWEEVWSPSDEDCDRIGWKTFAEE
jgi:hypothetical protein